MSKILAIYDMSGIQRFIFATNKVKEITGASQIVHNALYKNVSECFGMKENDWENDKVTDDGKSHIIYIGGGNALVLYNTENEYKTATKKIFQNVFLQSGGAIRVFSEQIEFDETISLSENQKNLMAKLDAAKKSGGSSSPLTLLPIMAYDNNNYEPIKEVENGKYYSFSRYLKESTKSVLLDGLAPEGKKFLSGFDGERREDQKNYQAIIHIDGNTMGIKIREAIGKLSGSVFDQMNGLKALSIEISNVYKDTLKKAISDTFENKKSGSICFRPIILDGDDITVMIESKKAFTFVENFMRRLSTQKFKTIDNFTPTAAAGIAFVGLKYPFSVAYEMAEACCHNSKKVTVERCSGAEKFNKSPKSSMDWQICYSNIPDDIGTYRKKNYRHGGYDLIRRPYVFGEDEEYSYEKFKNTLEYVISGKVARSKLKGLRNALGVSVEEAERYYNYIVSHNSDDATELKPFNDKKESEIFDCLDVMDIAWEGDSNETDNN